MDGFQDPVFCPKEPDHAYFRVRVGCATELTRTKHHEKHCFKENYDPSATRHLVL